MYLNQMDEESSNRARFDYANEKTIIKIGGTRAR